MPSIRRRSIYLRDLYSDLAAHMPVQDRFKRLGYTLEGKYFLDLYLQLLIVDHVRQKLEPLPIRSHDIITYNTNTGA